MANPEHLEILKQGVEVWNKWREDNPSIRPDLSEAHLSNVEFSNAGGNIKADLRIAKRVRSWVGASSIERTYLIMSTRRLQTASLQV
jgi:hypothetical protein